MYRWSVTLVVSASYLSSVPSSPSLSLSIYIFSFSFLFLAFPSDILLTFLPSVTPFLFRCPSLSLSFAHSLSLPFPSLPLPPPYPLHFSSSSLPLNLLIFASSSLTFSLLLCSFHPHSPFPLTLPLSLPFPLFSYPFPSLCPLNPYTFPPLFPVPFLPHPYPPPSPLHLSASNHCQREQEFLVVRSTPCLCGVHVASPCLLLRPRALLVCRADANTVAFFVCFSVLVLHFFFPGCFLATVTVEENGRMSNEESYYLRRWILRHANKDKTQTRIHMH